MAHLNLMSSESIRRQALAEATRIWICLASLAAIGAALLVAGETWSAQKESQRLAALEAQHAPIRQLRSEIKELQTKISRLSSDQQLALELAANRSMVTLLGSLGTSAAAAGGDLYVASLKLERLEGLDATASGHVAQIEGICVDSLAVTRLADLLKETQLFSTVQITSSGSRQIQTRSAQTQAVTAFDLECRF